MSPIRDWSAEVDELCDLISEFYLDQTVGDRVRQRLRDRLDSYAAVSDEESFAAAVTEDTVAASGDLHLRLRHSVAPLPELDERVVPRSGRHPREAALSTHGFRRVERLTGNVGVVEIERFFPLSMSRHAAIGAMHLVADCDVLLVDLRNSMGGEPDMVAFVCSFFFEERVHLTDLYFPAEDRTVAWWTDPQVPPPCFGGTKPVYVLTSGDTISAAEGFAYDLQQRKRSVVVGETTAGAANFDYRYRVTEHLMFSVPSGYPVNPISGGGWEGIGIAPDIEASADQAEQVAHRLALEHVLSLGARGHRRLIHEQAAQALAGQGPTRSG